MGKPSGRAWAGSVFLSGSGWEPFFPLWVLGEEDGKDKSQSLAWAYPTAAKALQERVLFLL